MNCYFCKREILTIPANLGGRQLCPTCADNLTHNAPALLAACEATADLLSQLWTPNAPTIADIALLRGRLEARHECIT